MEKIYKRTKETREKMRLSKLDKKNPMFGKKLQEEHRKKISEKLKGKIPKNLHLLHSKDCVIKREKTKKETIYSSIEWKKNSSERFKGHKNHFFGKKHSKKSLEKMSITHKLKPSHYWLGKKRPEISGENNYNWKGGKETEKARAVFYQRKRQSLKKTNGNTHTFEQWQEIKKKFNYMCLCCKRSEPEITLSQDHIIPLSKGGSDEISNIQPLCRLCNSRKGVKHIDFISQYYEIKQTI